MKRKIFFFDELEIGVHAAHTMDEKRALLLAMMVWGGGDIGLEWSSFG